MQRSSAALHCCKARSKINRKMENYTPCKIVILESFILKLGTRDYAEDVTNYIDVLNVITCAKFLMSIISLGGYLQNGEM